MNMITTDFVHAPPAEELVDTDMVQAPVNFAGDGDDDGDDALSLCNLSLCRDAADDSFADDVASTSSSSSSSSDHDDLFEFSSIWDSDSSSNRSIVFCGKLIPRGESPPNRRPPATSEKKGSSLQTCHGSQKSTTTRTPSPTVQRSKSRWYLMAFGLARFPTEMALSEMRTRQSRNLEKRGSCAGGGDIVKSGDHGDKSKWKGLFGLLKSLKLGHRHRADSLVKASLGNLPRL